MKLRLMLIAMGFAGLTACGGGSGGVVAISPTPKADGTTTNPNNPANPTTGNTNPALGTNLSSNDTSKPKPTTTLNTSIQGVMTSVSKEGASGIGATTATSDISKIVIGNKTISLGSNVISGSSFANVRYGYLANESTPTLFAQGLVSSEVPSTGKATYRGSAVHVVSDGSKTTSRVVPASFAVDFDKKVLTGTVRASDNINLGANISGNRFTGTVNGVSTTGYFYGDKADELGGIYKNTDGTVSGAYGAKK